MNRVVHFEISADDPTKAADFYSKVFGWEIKKWEGEFEYWLVMTGDEKDPGIDGAIMRRSYPKGNGTINTISVEDADQSKEKIIQAGGKQVTDFEIIPKVGKFAYFEDTEGNMFGVLQWKGYM
ncbi:MAG: VOC family protein [Caldisericia bacterium]|nr:VOC family protein [Caldisericia bacterium]